MDKLLVIANNYLENFEGKRFIVELGKKNTKMTIKIYFGAKHFHHLIGLQYLTDLPVHTMNTKNAFKQILDGKITYKDISKSKHFKKIENRLFCMEYLSDLFFDPNIIVRSNGKFKSINANFLFMKNNPILKHMQLFFGKNENDVYFPISMFSHMNESYLHNGLVWKVLSIKEDVDIIETTKINKVS